MQNSAIGNPAAISNAADMLRSLSSSDTSVGFPPNNGSILQLGGENGSSFFTRGSEIESNNQRSNTLNQHSSSGTGSRTAGSNQTDSFQGFRNNSELNENDLVEDSEQPLPANPQQANFSFAIPSNQPGFPSDGVRTGPRYREYALKTVRLTSFRSWPSSLKTPEELAEAGFYSTNNADCVRCFMCGIGLKNWDPEDDPWVEHARWSSKCSYLREKKGIDFVNLVQAAVRQAEIEETLQQNARSATGGSNGDVEVDSPLQTQKQVHGQTYQPSPTEKKNPMLCPAAQSAIEMGYLPKIVKRAIDVVLEQKGWIGMTATNVMEVILDIEEKEKDSGERILISQKPKTESENDIETDNPELKQMLKAENAELKERKTCKICCENTVSIVFLPCGHLVCCAQCSPALKDCPVCRTTVRGTVRICLA